MIMKLRWNLQNQPRKLRCLQKHDCTFKYLIIITFLCNAAINTRVQNVFSQHNRQTSYFYLEYKTFFTVSTERVCDVFRQLQPVFKNSRTNKYL